MKENIQTSIEPPEPKIEYESIDNYYGIQLTPNSESEFVLKGHNIKVKYEGREGQKHFLILTVDNISKNVIASPAESIEIGASKIQNKDGMAKEVEGIHVYRIQIEEVVFVIRPVSKIKDKDGDGLVGEDPKNEKDDDGDGKIDEDPYSFYWDFTNWNTDTLKIDIYIVKKLEEGHGGSE